MKIVYLSFAFMALGIIGLIFYKKALPKIKPSEATATPASVNHSPEAGPIEPTVVDIKRLNEDKYVIELAQKEVTGKLDTYPDAPIKVERKEKEIIVTFGVDPKEIRGPGFHGPDYAAQVVIDSITGKMSLWAPN